MEMTNGFEMRPKAYTISDWLAVIITVIMILILVLFFAVSRGLHIPSRDAAQFTPFLPPSYPLAVRSPYLSAWLPGEDASSIATSQAQFWAGQTLGWSVAARVDGKVYSLFGNPGIGETATLASANFTSTHTYFTLAAGTATFTLDFFSPVSPSDYIRQSLPFSYLTVSVQSSLTSNVQVYSDIDSSWTGSSADATWNKILNGQTTHFEIRLDAVVNFGENSDMALWGQAVYASRPYSGSNMTIQTGTATLVREQFANQGTLTGAFASWSAAGVVGFAHDLGKPENGAAVTFAIGHQRNWTINYLGATYTGYYRAKYPSIASAVSQFLDDHDNAIAEAFTLDQALQTKAGKVSQDYADITALSLRQAFGAIEITIPESTMDTNNPLAFIKEISSDGNVNTVDIIFPAFPLYYVTNPSLIKLLVEPILRYLAAGRWCKPYIIHDIGSNYPNATGHDDCNAEAMPLEESGNIIILAYAYQHATEDTSWAEEYQSVFTGAAKYLQENGWYPADQLATTDAAGAAPNQTVLAIKSALGMVTYDKLFSINQFGSNGSALANALYNGKLGTSSQQSHWDLTYSEDNTWMGAYNLFPDLLFSTKLFPQAAYDMQSTYLPTVREEIGVPLDSRVQWTKTDWNSWIAAVSSTSTRDMYINDIHSYVSNGKNNVPFADRYSVAGANVGEYISTRNRPTVGAHFALLALQEGPGGLLK